MPEENGQGFLSGLAGSLKDHFDERVKSPFAGAFAIAWVVCNWQALLILAFSSSGIEDRIQVLVTEHFTLWSTLWLPLILATGIAVGFYVLSALFYILLQLYHSLQLQVDRWFDSTTIWLPPRRVIAQKKKFQDQISALEGMASDNAGKVDEANSLAAEANQKLTELQQELVERSGQVGKLSHEAADIKNRLLLERGRLKEAIADVERLKKENERLRDQLDFFESRVNRASEMVERGGEGVNQWGGLSKWFQSMQEANASISSGRASPGKSIPTTLDSLEIFLAAKYPGLVVDRALLGLVLRDLKVAQLADDLATIDAVDKVLRRAQAAVDSYSEKNPKVFQKGADFLSKSLGFVYPRFRSAHKFSNETRKAFTEFEHLVER